jgi:hypothetical protein
LVIEKDNLHRLGAERLARTIRDYWRAKAYRGVLVWIEPIYFDGGRLYVVKSNLVGGMPPDD